MPRARSPMDSFHARRAPPLSPSTMSYETATTTRSCSPLHFLNPAAMVYGATLTTTSSSFSTTKATTPSKASSSKRRRHSADVSRLLDPSYLPSSTAAKTARSASVSVYVDPAGDLHDPDYRHFPVALPAHSHAHHHSSTHYNHSTHHQHSGYNTSYAYNHAYAYTHAGTRRPTSPARPHFDWELAVDESALDDEYPEDEEDLLAHAHQSQYHQAHRAPMNARRSSVSTTATMRTGGAGYGGCYSPTGTASTLPTSCEDEDASPFEAEAEKESEKAKESEKVKEKENELKEKENEKDVKDKRRRRLSKGDKEKEKARAKDAARMRDAEKAFIRRVSFDADPTTSLTQNDNDDDARTHEEDERREVREEEDEDDDDEDAEARRVLREQGAYVPSCGESLRREWQAFALRVRFGVFRARRRVARRVQALLS
ncbi:hypothetical protein BJ912DRAFT_995380 [Pholiota molesta]|nr:hypothetical protein BJ912DRAFT_995380 [Pholiota molesta]